MKENAASNQEHDHKWSLVVASRPQVSRCSFQILRQCEDVDSCGRFGFVVWDLILQQVASMIEVGQRCACFHYTVSTIQPLSFLPFLNRQKPNAGAAGLQSLHLDLS